MAAAARTKWHAAKRPPLHQVRNPSGPTARRAMRKKVISAEVEGPDHAAGSAGSAAVRRTSRR
jgi:hypothetical protein